MIRVLPDHLINKIAAGEVVERPASVLKELLENSVDAGATSIAIDVEGGGRRRIRVADDGIGLDRDDALMALERHATSKLGATDDLARIVTLGFRGEALPAIASVSRMTLTTCSGTGAGTRIDLEGGVIRKVADAAHPRGTTVDVRDLFFNTPARSKFLRTPSTELGHVSEMAASFCLSIPAIRVALLHEGRTLLDLPPAGDLKERLRRAFGEAWGDAIPFSGARGDVSVFGLILPPERSLSTRRMQRVYVNGRLVKDRLITHAIAAACESRFPKDRHAEVVVQLTCPPEAVDVNVHPAKAEVRFVDSRPAHDLVANAIAAAVTSAMPVTPVHDPDTRDTPGAPTGPWPTGAPRGPMGPLSEAAQRFYSPVSSPRVDREPTAAPLPGIDEGAVALAHYRESYILAEDAEGLLIIDQHAAHERILFEQLVDAGDTQEIHRQGLLFPLTVTVPRILAHRIEEALVELDHLGFGAEPFGEGTMMIREAPAIVDAGALPALMDGIFAQMADDELPPTGTPRNEKLLATVACHAAIKVRMPLTMEKMHYLARELFRTRTPLKCPHGRPAVLRFSQLMLEKGFDRR